MRYPDLGLVYLVLDQVAAERTDQHRKWGEQDHPDGTGGASFIQVAEDIKSQVDQAAAGGILTYRDLLLEEVAEAFAESDRTKLKAELIQVAAVAVAWVEKLIREEEKGN